MRYLAITACFVCTNMLGVHAVWIACGILLASFALLFCREFPPRHIPVSEGSTSRKD